MDLANAVFAALKRKPKIEFIEMPEAIRDKYQYFTQANLGPAARRRLHRTRRFARRRRERLCPQLSCAGQAARSRRGLKP